MNNRRKIFIALGAGALVRPFGSFAQQKSKVSTGAGSWDAISKAPGVTLATDFGSAAEVDPHRYANASSTAQFNELIKRVKAHREPDGTPCLKIDVVPGVGDTQGQSWRRRMNPAWQNEGDGFGTQEYFVQFGFKIPPSRLIPHTPGAGSWKFVILANMSITNPMGQPRQSSNEMSHVLTNRSRAFVEGGVVKQTVNFPIVYIHTQNVPNGAPFQAELPGGIFGSDLNLSPGWDRGPQYTSPHERYCSYRFPHLGCPIWPQETWVKFQYRLRIRTPGGTAGNELDFYWALPGDTDWTILQSARNFPFSAREDRWPNGHNAIWLTVFETDRTSAPGVASYVLYRNLVVSTQRPAFPTFY